VLSRRPLGTPYGDPLQVDAVDTGLQRCESGLIHRPEPVACQSALPRPLPPTSGVDAGEGATTQVQLLYSLTLALDPCRVTATDQPRPSPCGRS
jgi:hypothetical protein